MGRLNCISGGLSLEYVRVPVQQENRKNAMSSANVIQTNAIALDAVRKS